VISQFISDVGDPATTILPGGIWDINVFAAVNNNAPIGSDISFVMNVYTWDGSTKTTIATSSDTYISTPSQITEYASTVRIPQTNITNTTRIGVDIEAINHDATDNHDIVVYFEGNRVSHVHTSIGAPGGTGVVKVVSGIYQTPATLISNSDVATNAAIAGTKISPDFGGQNIGTTGSFTSASGKITGLSTGVVHSDGSGNLSSSTIVNADVSASAAIDGSKITSATSSVLGVIKLTGDLGGTANGPTVTKIQGYAVSATGPTSYGSYLYWDSGTSAWTVGSDPVKIGSNAGQTSQGTSAIAIGTSSGTTAQGNYGVAIGYQAGQTSQLTNSVAIGYQSGNNNQKSNSTAIGNQSGRTSQGQSAVSIGDSSGYTTQGNYGVAVGYQSGYDTQATLSVAIGYQSGRSNQGAQSVAIGYQAGNTGQGITSVALGNLAGFSSQSDNSVAIGNTSARYGQGTQAVAIGNSSGNTGQGNYAIAIGSSAGNTGQGTNSIAIGQYAGQTSQHNNSIIFNASGSAVNSGTTGALYINPIRNASLGATYAALYYNSSTSEVFAGPTGAAAFSPATPGANRIITSDGTTSGATAQANLTFDGTTLTYSSATLSNTNTQIVTRDAATGNINYSDSASANIVNYGVIYAMSSFNYLI